MKYYLLLLILAKVGFGANKPQYNISKNNNTGIVSMEEVTKIVVHGNVLISFSSEGTSVVGSRLLLKDEATSLKAVLLEWAKSQGACK